MTSVNAWPTTTHSATSVSGKRLKQRLAGGWAGAAGFALQSALPKIWLRGQYHRAAKGVVVI